jgi:hypothetical protein
MPFRDQFNGARPGSDRLTTVSRQRPAASGAAFTGLRSRPPRTPGSARGSSYVRRLSFQKIPAARREDCRARGQAAGFRSGYLARPRMARGAPRQVLTEYGQRGKEPPPPPVPARPPRRAGVPAGSPSSSSPTPRFSPSRDRATACGRTSSASRRHTGTSTSLFSGAPPENGARRGGGCRGSGHGRAAGLPQHASAAGGPLHLENNRGPTPARGAPVPRRPPPPRTTHRRAVRAAEGPRLPVGRFCIACSIRTLRIGWHDRFRSSFVARFASWCLRGSF